MKLGFTGTRAGLTYDQSFALGNLIRAFRDVFDEFHHGDCVGSDMEAHELVRVTAPRTKIIVHPPEDLKLRAYTDGDMLQPKPYIERNHDIVDCADVLIVCPRTDREILRSGTWATYRYAKQHKKPVIILYP